MAARVVTVAFEGVEARRVDVEVQLTTGQHAFVVVGLADKAVAESRERVRGAFAGLGLSLPGKRIVANLAPADMPKEEVGLAYSAGMKRKSVAYTDSYEAARPSYILHCGLPSRSWTARG